MTQSGDGIPIESVKRFAPGQREYPASDLNAVVNTVQALVRKVDAAGPFHGPAFWATIHSHGGPDPDNPRDMLPDYDDARYWVARARVTNTDGDTDPTSILQVERYKETLTPPGGAEIQNPAYELITATNIAELPDSTHDMPVNDEDPRPVRVWSAYDQSDPPIERFYFNSALNGIPSIGIVTACSRNTSTGDVTVTAKTMTGLPFSYENGVSVVAYAGVTPILKIYTMVLLFPLNVPVDNIGDFSHFALPLLSIDPTQINTPDATCVTRFATQCATPTPPSDYCVEG